ncbi:MAG: MOP flippase family protein [Lentisphaerae bacterium]|nr:MOP flippase family protein [Lentisphaerota bacterium]
MDSLRDKTLRGMRWSGISQGVRQGLQFAVSVMLARLLTPSDFGLYAMIVVFTGFAQMLGDLGFASALVQRKDVADRHYTAVFWTTLLAGAVLALAMAAVAPAVALLYGQPRIKPLMLAVAMGFPLAAAGVVHRAHLQRALRFGRLAAIDIAALLGAGAVATSLALSGGGVWSLVAQSLTLSALTTFGCWIACRWRPAWQFDRAAVRDLAGFSGNLVGFNVMNYWIRKLDDLLVGCFLGSWALGIYGRAYQLMLLPLTQISGFATQVMFPAMASIQDDRPRLKRIYLRATRIIALVVSPLMVGLFVVAEPFILVVFGRPWIEVVPVLRIFCLTGLYQAMAGTVGWIYLSLGETRLMFRWGLAAGAITALAFAIGLRWGIVGVAAAYTLCGCCILLYPSVAIPGRLIGLRFSEFVRHVAPPLVAALAMGILVWALGVWLPPACPLTARLALQTAAGAAVYVALVSLLKLTALGDFISMCTRPGAAVPLSG